MPLVRQWNKIPGMVYGVFLEKKPEAALTELNIISALPQRRSRLTFRGPINVSQGSFLGRRGGA